MVYQSSLGFDERPVLAVDLVVKSARVAQVLSGAVASPQRRRRRTAVDTLTTFCNTTRLRSLSASYVRQHLNNDDCPVDERRLSELFCAVLCTTVVHSGRRTS